MQEKELPPENDPLRDLLGVLNDFPEPWDQLFEMLPLVKPFPAVVVMFDDLDRSTPRLKIDAAPLLASEELNPSVCDDEVLTLLPKVLVVGSTLKTR